MQEHRQNSYIASIGCFVCSIMVVAFCAVSALPDHGFSLAISQYAAVLALSALLLFSPALVSIPLQRKYGMVWYCSEGVATLLLLFCAFVLGALGLPIGRFLLIGLGTLAGLVMLARGLTEKLPLPALGVVSVIGSLFFVLVFYSQGYHSPLFSEKVMLGQAHIDTLFHAAIANLFGTYHEITTGLHFHPQLKYHAGSHVLFWGLSRLTGLHPVDFYNVAYPAIFLPLYLKSLFLFAIAYARKLGTNTFSLTFLLLVLVVCYSTGYSRLGLMDPLVSESNAVALTLIFLYLSSLLSLAPRPVSPRNATAFLAFSFSVILWATFTKVSVGFIFIGAVTYLLLRVSNFRPKGNNLSAARGLVVR